jgi:nucleoid DNA-binding protein
LEKVLNSGDLIDNIQKYSAQRKKYFIRNEYDKKVVRKILSLYFHYMTEALFKGYEWYLPGYFGKIKIKAKTYEVPTRIPFFKKHLKNPDVHNKRVSNPKTPGLVYKVEITSECMEKHKCRFKAAKSIRTRLFNELFNGDLAKLIK